MFSIAFAHMLASLAWLLQLGGQVRWSPLHAIWWTSIFVCVVSNWISQRRPIEPAAGITDASHNSAPRPGITERATIAFLSIRLIGQIKASPS